MSIRRAFTLIELLVVVAIIALLISILLPSLKKARDQAKSAVCLSNLKNMGTATGTYLAENNGYFPGDHVQLTKTQYMTWVPRLWSKYLGRERKIFFCPSLDQGLQWNPRTGYTPPNENAAITLRALGYDPGEYPLQGSVTEFFSYGYNAYGIRPSYGDTDHYGLGGHIKTGLYQGSISLDDGPKQWEFPEAKVKRAAEMYMVADSIANGSYDVSIDPFVPNTPTVPNTSWPGNRHNKGANTLFCDGHAAQVNFKRMVLQDEGQRARWNNDALPHRDEWGDETHTLIEPEE